MNPFDLVIFDLDGTLIDSRSDIASALNQALAEAGLPTYPDEAVAQMIGDGFSVLVRRALGPAHAAAETRVRDAFCRLYAANLVRKTGLYPGVRELLEGAREAGLRLAIATNKPGDWAREIVRSLGIDQLFERVLGDLDGFERKPNPAMALALLRDIPPSGALLVGDSVIDVGTARAAKTKAAAVTWGYGQREELTDARPDFLLDSAAALAAVLCPMGRTA